MFLIFGWTPQIHGDHGVSRLSPVQSYLQRRRESRFDRNQLPLFQIVSTGAFLLIVISMAYVNAYLLGRELLHFVEAAERRHRLFVPKLIH